MPIYLFIFRQVKKSIGILKSIIVELKLKVFVCKECEAYYCRLFLTLLFRSSSFYTRLYRINRLSDALMVELYGEENTEMIEGRQQ